MSHEPVYNYSSVYKVQIKNTGDNMKRKTHWGLAMDDVKAFHKLAKKKVFMLESHSA